MDGPAPPDVGDALTRAAGPRTAGRWWAPLRVVLAGCGGHDAEAIRLAARCMSESPDNRVRHSGAWLSDAEVELDGDRVIVRVEVPAGFSLDAKVRFRHHEFECRREGERLVFVAARWG